MQVISSGENTEIEVHFTVDFSVKVNVTDDTRSEQEEKPPQQEVVEEKEEEEEDSEEEFSFGCINTYGSPISADDIFHNGQIRPVFPLFDHSLLFSNTAGNEDSESKSSPALRPPLRKLFVEERDQASASSSEEQEEPEGPYCFWRGTAVEATPEVCKKSNSTGFSKLWRFRERVLRSNSDGKDAFVFLNHQNHNTSPSPLPPSSGKKTERSEKVVEEEKKVAKKEKRGETAPSLSAHYVRNRKMKEGEKRRSYLPYRPELVGFFTNVNGLSRNVHPF